MLSNFIEPLLYALTVGLGVVGILALPFSRRWAWLILVGGIPWASEIADLDLFTLTLPTDALAVLGSLGIIFYVLFHPEKIVQIFSSSILRWIIAYIAWMGITTLTSTDTTVSMKFFLSQSAYFIAFGIGAYLWSKREGTDLSLLYLRVLGVSAIIVLGLCVFQHIELGALRSHVDKAIEPFMREHTVYGAYSAWFFTSALVLVFMHRSFYGFILLGISAVALLLSYSRGGWLSALAALVIWGMIELLRRLTPYVRLLVLGGIVLGSIAGITFLVGYNPEILRVQARQIVGEIGEHAATSFDLKKNPSNLERINRWFAALQMIEDRPWFGFGANTFAQEYSAYQRSLTRTSISVEMGEVGGAHSEYLTAAAELGIVGLILLLGIYLTTLGTGIGGIWREKTPERRWSYALFTLPLISYYLHGIINNFMDHGHMAALVYLHWGVMAALQREAVPSPHAELERV